MALRDRIAALFRRSIESGTPGIEGQPKEGPWLVTTGDHQGWLPSAWGQFWNFWQMDYDPLPMRSSAIVEACISAYAETIAMCPGDEWWLNPQTGGRERVTTSALCRVLRKPNDYQSRSDFFLNLTRDLYAAGNSYALAQRNDRNEVTALHPFNPRSSRPLIGPQGEVFYQLAGNNVLENAFRGAEAVPGFSAVRYRETNMLVVPARDVLHAKLQHQPNEPLSGVAPLRHATLAIAAQLAIGDQLVKSFGNMNRPAGVIETEQNLTAQQVKDLRQRFNEAWHGINDLQGGPPILTNGFKFHGISTTPKDADLVNALKMTQDEVFMVYGVPPAILGMTDRAAFASTEALMQFWLARGLGFAINHIETAFDHFFGLKGWPENYVELDTNALLRVAYKDRIDALARGVQGGIYAPNEARAAEDLPRAKDGDEPRVQQQVVPLSAWSQAQPQTPRPEAAEPAAPAAAAEGEAPEEAEPGETEEEAQFEPVVFERGASHEPSRAIQ